MTLPTPDMIEKAARALFDASEGEFKSRFKWDHLRKDQRERAIKMARAALEAVVPDVVDECAEVAEKLGSGVENIAAVIRHLVFCPHSMRHRPVNFPIVDCIAAGECGCDNRCDNRPTEEK